MKPRDDKSIEAAVLAVIHHLTIGVVAKLVDRGESTIRHWADPDHDGRPTIQQCLLMDSACIERGVKPPLLDAYLAHLKAAGQGADPVVQDLLIEALQLSASVGALHSLVGRAKDLGSEGGAVITPNEAMILRKALKAVRAEVDDVGRAIDAGLKAARKR